jgi:GLPGLI family protein
MATRKYLLIFIVAMSCFDVTAQPTFIYKGKIEFEKKVNMHKTIGDNSWAEQMKSRLPQYSTTYYDLVFDEHQSAFKLGKEAPDDPWKKMFGGTNEDEYLIYNNYDSGQTITSKQVFEKLYLVKDSLVPIEWRITNDTRKIAGFECRKAVGRFFDTLYVVAFYTDEIITPAGPANYVGLPGMILGVALPRFHTTMFATKLELETPTVKQLTPPTKGKKASRTELFTQVKEATSRWGDEWQKYFWQAML